MKSRYDNAPGKEAAIANVRQRRLEAEHAGKNAFVKRQQMEMDKYAGKRPDLKNESLKFNAYMCNNGEHAQMLGKKLTSGIDHTAFPVDGQGDDS